jgi:hypothetical protein
MAYTEKRRKGTSTFKSFGKAQPNKDTMRALRSFEHSSDKNSSNNLMRFAEISPSVIVYLQCWKGLSNADMIKVMESKGDKEKAENLAAIANQKGSATMLIQDNSKKGLVSRHHFKVIKKSEAKKEPEKQELKAEANNPIKEESHLPSEKEIYDKAVEMYQKENFKPVHGDSGLETAPIKSELAEEGYLQKAKLALMTSEDTQASRQVFDYVGKMREELSKLGFDVVPISGFDVSDLQY